MNSVNELYLLEVLKSLKGLKSNAEKAMEQISGNDYHFQPDPESNSVAILMKHMAGNMISRFTDFLTTDGEKSWRKRDDEFIDDRKTETELLTFWNKGWDCLLGTINSLKSEDLLKTVFIRGEEHTVLRALQRQLVHYSYHTGQIVYLCKQIRKSEFKSLSIPRNPSGNIQSQSQKK